MSARTTAAGADAIVIGAGVIGCAVALRLAQAGARVLVLDRGEPGAEASGAAAGILGAQMEASGPGPMLELCLASRALHPALAAELRELTGLEVRHRACGVLELAFSDHEEAELRARHAWQAAAGLRAELVSSAQLAARRTLAPALLGLWLPDDAQVDNQLLTTALQLAATRAGVTFRPGAPVRRLLRAGVEGRCRGVALDDGEATAPTVVLAAGAWSGSIEGVPLPEGAVVPVRGQMVSLLPRPLPFTEVVGGAAGYAVPRLDGRLLVGATVERLGFHKGVTAQGLQGLLAQAQALAPSLSDARVEAHWSGLRPGTADGLPILGSSAVPGLLFATGHFRNGILLAPLTAELIRDLALGGPPRRDLRPFAAERFAPKT